MLKKRNITPDKVVEIFNRHGTIITMDEAKLVLDHLYKFGSYALEIIFRKQF